MRSVPACLGALCLWLCCVSTGRAQDADFGLDLVNLGTAYAEASGEVKAAKVRVDGLTSRLQSREGSVTDMDVQIAKIALSTAQKKHQVLQTILNEEREATQNRIEALRRIRDPGGQIIRLEARLRILAAIQASNES